MEIRDGGGKEIGCCCSSTPKITGSVTGNTEPSQFYEAWCVPSLPRSSFRDSVRYKASAL